MTPMADLSPLSDLCGPWLRYERPSNSPILSLPSSDRRKILEVFVWPSLNSFLKSKDRFDNKSRPFVGRRFFHSSFNESWVGNVLFRLDQKRSNTNVDMVFFNGIYPLDSPLLSKRSIEQVKNNIERWCDFAWGKNVKQHSAIAPPFTDVRKRLVATDFVLWVETVKNVLFDDARFDMLRDGVLAMPHFSLTQKNFDRLVAAPTKDIVARIVLGQIGKLTVPNSSLLLDSGSLPLSERGR